MGRMVLDTFGKQIWAPSLGRNFLAKVLLRTRQAKVLNTANRDSWEEERSGE